MSRGIASTTRVLLQVVENMLDGLDGPCDLTPLLDDVAIAYRRQMGGTLKAAGFMLKRRLSTVQDLLEEDDWYTTVVTEYYVRHYKNRIYNHPTDDAEIMRCVAGAGTTDPTYALHFCNTKDCILFIEKSILGMHSGARKIERPLERISGMQRKGLITGDGIRKIADASDLQPLVRTIRQLGQGPRKDGAA